MRLDKTMFVTKKERIRSLLAVSLYEPLEDAERRELDAALAESVVLRREAEVLLGVKKAIRLETPEFKGNLAPFIRQQILEQKSTARTSWTVWIWSGSTLTLASFVLVFFLTFYPGSGIVSKGQTGPVASLSAPASSSMQIALNEAEKLVNTDKIAEASQILQQALAVFPDDSQAGEAQRMLADMEFSHFQRYPEAFAAYERLRTRYPQTFMASREGIQRYNLLDEARRADYAQLYALDVARSRPIDAFAQYERLVAQYPDSLLASLAIDEMRFLLDDSGKKTGGTVASALEQVRDRCTDPTAITQVNLALGNVYCDDLNDAVRARYFYNQAVASPHHALAARAEEALARLSTNAR